MFKDKSLLRWKEPPDGFEAARKEISRKNLVKAFVVSIGKWTAGGLVISLIIYAFISYRNGFALNETAVILFLTFPAISSTLGFVGLMTGYRNAANPPEIMFFAEVILVRYFLGNEAQIAYKEIQSYDISQVEAAGRKFRVLEIKDWRGNEFEIEIAQDIGNEIIAEIFKSKNVQMSAIQSYM